MDFFEFQDHVEEQEILLKYIIQKFQEKEFIAKKESSLFLDENKIYIIKSGLLLKENIRTRAGRLYGPYEVIDILPRHCHATLFYGKIAVFDKVYLFDELEKADLLSNFIYYLWKNKLTELRQLEKNVILSVKQRIINFISDFSIHSANRYFSPKFISINLIAICCLCSARQVSRVLSDFEAKGIISSMNKRPIYINDFGYIQEHSSKDKKNSKISI